MFSWRFSSFHDAAGFGEPVLVDFDNDTQAIAGFDIVTFEPGGQVDRDGRLFPVGSGEQGDDLPLGGDAVAAVHRALQIIRVPALGEAVFPEVLDIEWRIVGFRAFSEDKIPPDGGSGKEREADEEDDRRNGRLGAAGHGERMKGE
jgi:hypothetical protein